MKAMRIKIFLLMTTFLTLSTLMSQDIENRQLLLPNSKVTLKYLQAGSGNNAIVLIHGLGSNSKAYQKNIQELSKKAVVFALDLPGYGNTELGSFVPGIDNYARAISEFIELKKLSNVTLVGHSMGGQIAIQLAADHKPSWLKKLVLLSPAGVEQFTDDEKKWFHAVVNEQLYLGMTDDQIKQNFNRNFFGEKLPEDAKFMVSERFELKDKTEEYKTYISTIVKSIYAMLAEPIYDKIADIKVPILVIYGKNDMLIPNKILHPQLSLENLLKKLRADYPDIKIEQFEEAGHFVLWDQSVAINRCILEDIVSK